MIPLVPLFLAATVAGVGATVGHRLARDLILPWADRTARRAQREWHKMERRTNERRRREYEDYVEPKGDDAPAADVPPPGPTPSGEDMATR